MATRDLLNAIQNVEKRAERFNDDEILATYVGVESLTPALLSRDNGIIFGRRGTGKTHALKYIAETQRSHGNRVIYIDLENEIGSTEGRFNDPRLPESERATRLVVDVLSIVHSHLLDAAFAGDIPVQIDVLEEMLQQFQRVLVTTELETEDVQEESVDRKRSGELGGELGVSGPRLRVNRTSSDDENSSSSVRVKRVGHQRHRIDFGGVTRMMRQVVTADPSRQIWLLLDEWSSLPLDLQPYVAEMLRKLFLGHPKVIVRIAAISHRSEWRIAGARGNYVGLEVGEEIFPIADLDDFVVFPAKNRQEQAQRSLSFFKSLLYRHTSSALREMDLQAPANEDAMIADLFTQVTALQEGIRAAEGVPRDALAIFARAAMRAGGSKVAVNHIREAASQLYITNKHSKLNGVSHAHGLLDKIVHEVISGRKARAFLVHQDQTGHALLQQLVDDRVLHIIKRGWSAKDNPGERFDVLQIDYGCYVNRLGTQAAPQGLFGDGDDQDFQVIMGSIEVPQDDYRAIRRAVLDLPSVLQEIGA